MAANYGGLIIPLIKILLLGKYPVVNLSEACIKVEKARQLLANEQDPSQKKQEERQEQKRAIEHFINIAN